MPPHPYTLKRSRRAKRLTLRVVPGGEVVVTAPPQTPERTISGFVYRNAEWIRHAVARTAHLKPLPVAGRRDYLAHKESARAFITERVRAWSVRLGYEAGRIAIKDTARSWGSCSRAGNLNFTYKLLFIPNELADYVVVHELCHIKEANHSPHFWALVEAALPDYRERRRELRRYVLK